MEKGDEKRKPLCPSQINIHACYSTPSSFVDHRDAHILRSYVAEAEQMKSLHPAQLAIIYKHRWFKLFVPAQYGGLGLPLPEALKIEESLAWVDGCVGWTVTLCSGANWFIGFLRKDTAATLFHSDKVCFAGSGRPSGIAKMISNDEYEISGSWQYATGAAHATAFTANCHLETDGNILKTEDGTPVIATFIFLRSEVLIHDDWKGMGMIATSSNRFDVSGLRMDKSRRFEIDENKTTLPDKIYQYPFLQFAESTLAVNISGMAIHFMDLFEANLKEKKLSDHFTKHRRRALFTRSQVARNKHQEAREKFYRTLQHSWDQWDDNTHFTAASLDSVSQVSSHLASVSRDIVDAIFPFCGLVASDPNSEINRVWRNLHTAILHPLLLP